MITISVIIHNNATYRLLYQRYSNKFIDEYCHARNLGYPHDMASNLAKIGVMESLIESLYQTNQIKKVLYDVFKALQEDYTLYEKAIQKFNSG